MKLETPALHVRKLEVYRALFEAQIDDTITKTRDHLKEWSAVHIVALQAGTLRRTMPREQMAQFVLGRIAPDGCALEPDMPVDDPKVPDGTLVSVQPNAIIPKIATQYTGWTYVPYPDVRRRLRSFEAKVLGKPTLTNTVTELFALTSHPIALDGGGTTGKPEFLKALEACGAKEGKALFCDGQFGFEAPAGRVTEQADQILHMPGRTREMLYFGDTWFVAFLPNGRVRVALIEG
jgi:hypothetical protein